MKLKDNVKYITTQIIYTEEEESSQEQYKIIKGSIFTIIKRSLDSFCIIATILINGRKHRIKIAILERYSKLYINKNYSIF